MKILVVLKINCIFVHKINDMRDKEYPPLLSSGFQDIEEGELENIFVKPFGNQNVVRTKLVQDFVLFLGEFKKMKISAEVWINGSFTTEAPDPNDIDIVFFFEPSTVNGLSDEAQTIFLRLFDKSNKKFIRNLYGVEVFAAIADDAIEHETWLKVFGTMYDNITPKGIFRLKYDFL